VLRRSPGWTLDRAVSPSNPPYPADTEALLRALALMKASGNLLFVVAGASAMTTCPRDELRKIAEADDLVRFARPCETRAGP
jgi:hypothetical protein